MDFLSSKKSQQPQMLATIIFGIAVIAVLWYIAFELLGLRENIYFFICSISADYRDAALRDFIGFGNLAKESVGRAMASLPMPCGVKSGGDVRDYKKINKADFLAELQKETARCWSTLGAGEGDFAYKLRNPFICELLAYELTEEVSMKDIRDVVDVPQFQLRSADDEYFTSVYEGYRSAPGLFDVSFSGPVSVFLDYFDYGEYGAGGVKNCEVEGVFDLRSACDSAQTVECGLVYGLPTGDGRELGSSDAHSQFGSVANFCKSLSSGLVLYGAPTLTPSSCTDAMLLCFRFEENAEVVKPTMNNMLIDTGEKLLEEIRICTGGESCENNRYSTSIKIDVYKKVKEIEFSWFTRKNVKIIASYHNGKTWNKFHELKAIDQGVFEKDKEHYSKTQINDDVTTIKFECDGENKEGYLCTLSGVLDITYFG